MEVVEGSGNLNSGKNAFGQLKKSLNTSSTLINEKKLELEGSGASPDDEDGDADDVEGSACKILFLFFVLYCFLVEGSGASSGIQPLKTKISKVTVTSTIASTISSNNVSF